MTDYSTGLTWEKKVNCNSEDLNNPRCYMNRYTWSALYAPTEPTGNLYSEFLESLNDLKTPNDGNVTRCFAGKCDWRIPTIGELRSILLASHPGCTVNPCIDPIFGPTMNGYYWSSNSLTTDPYFARFASFYDGLVGNNIKTNVGGYARAVRGGR